MQGFVPIRNPVATQPFAPTSPPVLEEESGQGSEHADDEFSSARPSAATTNFRLSLPPQFPAATTTGARTAGSGDSSVLSMRRNTAVVPGFGPGRRMSAVIGPDTLHLCPPASLLPTRSDPQPIFLPMTESQFPTTPLASPFAESAPFTFAAADVSQAPWAPQAAAVGAHLIPVLPTTAAASLFGTNMNVFSSPATGVKAKAKAEEAKYSPFDTTGMKSGGGAKTGRKHAFTSNLLTEEIKKPWLDKPDRGLVVARWLYIFFAVMGIVGGGLLGWNNWRKIPRVGNVCLVLEDNFDTLDPNIWNHEVEVSGFGNGEFEWTTDNSNNSFVKDGMLYIVPTLTENVLGQSAIFDGLNLTIAGCTAANVTRCITTSNATLGTVINPVQSARLTTRLSHSVKYGRIEVRARMPTGDWLWPAIWMLPTNSVYGDWPRSGEIDLVESRGNSASYKGLGADWIASTIHWGPVDGFDRAYMTTGLQQDRHTSYDKKFHTYVVEWNEDFLWIYIDQRTTRVLNIKFDEPFFSKGKFPAEFFNGTYFAQMPNPWAGHGNTAPYDQDFYLILNVAVGGTNGWFPDDIGNKPWINNSPQAMRDFAKAKDQWYPTWPEDVTQRGMAVDSVRMYQRC